MSRVAAAPAEADALLLAAEELLAEARARGQRIGLDAEASGLCVLQHAYAMAIGDAAGEHADADKLARLTHRGCGLLFSATFLHHGRRR